MRKLDGGDIDAVIQAGTNLAMARLAGSAHLWLPRPVLAINTAIDSKAVRLELALSLFDREQISIGLAP